MEVIRNVARVNGYDTDIVGRLVKRHSFKKAVHNSTTFQVKRDRPKNVSIPHDPSTTNPIHSFADDSTLHAGIMSNRPISVVELERRRLATAASLSKDLQAITAWGLKNMVEFNRSKTQYCTLSNRRCPSEHSVLMDNQALPRSH
nr:unnamed protein product [Callosobruchus chinensis]